MPWANRGVPGSRRWRCAGVIAAVGVVALVVLAVGVAADVVLPSRAGAEGLGSNDFSPVRDVVSALPCDRYGRYGTGPGGLEGISEPEQRMNRWVDRIPIPRSEGREIVFADGNAVYAAAVQGTQLGRLVRENTAFYMRTSMRTSDAGRFLQPLRWRKRHLGVSTANVDGRRSRYGLEGIVSFDVSRVDGALVYATCSSYQPDGGDPEIAACLTPAHLMDQAGRDYCFKNSSRREVRLAYPSGDVLFDIGDELYEIKVVRPEVGTGTRLAVGNYPTWSPDGQRIAFVSTYWHTVRPAGGDPPTGMERAFAFASTFWRMVTGAGGNPPSRVTRVDSVARVQIKARVQIMAADGTDQRSIELPPDRYADFPPRWSPDGSRLAFLVGEYERQGRDTLAIYTVRADGTGLQRLAAARSNPAWSPDGTRLAFVQAQLDGSILRLYTMAADGTDVRQITAAPSGSRWAWTLAWSPDGTRLLYWCLEATCVVGLDGQLVGKFPHFATELPAWSADGRRIALYNAAHGDRDDVVLASVAPDGSDWRALVHAGADGGLVADPAGDFLLPVAGPAVCRAGVVVPAPAQHPGLVADCEVLVALRAALLGRAARHWQTNRPLAEWAGVEVGGAPVRVRALKLRAETIGWSDHGEGLLPRIAELTALERLELVNNGLTGAIPGVWEALSRLRWLDLSGNQLTGTIPAELGQLEHLGRLHLANNQLTGTIPAELGQLEHLGSLHLANNQLTGTIPAALGQLEHLRELYLHNNQLTGTIPAALGQLRNLAYLVLSNNQLTGTIPAALGQLRNLAYLVLSNNQLTGTIPAALGQLQSLRELGLAYNQLTGCIPVGLKLVLGYDLAKLRLPDCEAGA